MLNEKGIQLESLVQMEFLKGSKIIAGHRGLDKLVLDVNIMVDLDILNWTKTGDLLLTTAYIFKDESIESMSELFKALSERGLAGLCIKIFPYINALDPELLKLADTLGLPIIDLNYETSFNEIMTPIYRLFLNRQALILDKVESVHRETMGILLKGGNASDIVEMLGSHLEHPTFYIDYQFDDVVEGVKSDPVYRDLTRGFNQSKQVSRAKKRLDYVVVDGVSVERQLIPVMVKDEIHGHLVAYGKQRKISNVDVLSLESAASLLAIESLKKLSIKEVENKYKAEFFDDLIANDLIRREKALERASNYGFRSDAFFSILSIKTDDVSYEDGKGVINNQRLNKIVYLLELMLMQMGNVYLVATKNDMINLLFMWQKKQDYEKQIDGLMAQVETTLHDKARLTTYTIGVGRCYQDLSNTSMSLRDAGKAIDLSGINKSRAIRFDQMGIYKLLSHDLLKDEILEFYEATVYPLVQYDQKRDTDLVKTLEVYFEMNGNLKKMSEALYTHYNTILYRISRIKEITKKDLENEHDRFGLQTALKIKHILELER